MRVHPEIEPSVKSAERNSLRRRAQADSYLGAIIRVFLVMTLPLLSGCTSVLYDSNKHFHERRTEFRSGSKKLEGVYLGTLTVKKKEFFEYEFVGALRGKERVLRVLLPVSIIEGTPEYFAHIEEIEESSKGGLKKPAQLSIFVEPYDMRDYPVPVYNGYPVNISLIFTKLDNDALAKYPMETAGDDIFVYANVLGSIDKKVRTKMRRAWRSLGYLVTLPADAFAFAVYILFSAFLDPFLG